MGTEIVTINSASESQQLMEMLRDMATNPAVDVSKMTALLGLKRDMMKDAAIAEFNQAFARLVPRLPRIIKKGSVSGNNGKEMFKFAKYEDIDLLIRPLLLEEGFSLSFTTEPLPTGGLLGHGKLLHVAGHGVTASMPAPVDASGGKNAIQGIGSTFAYLKRYLTTMLLNLVFEGEDDDAKRGGLRFIDARSVETINQLLDETNSDRARFLQNFEAAEVENIETKDFARAINMLHQKKAKMK